MDAGRCIATLYHVHAPSGEYMTGKELEAAVNKGLVVIFRNQLLHDLRRAGTPSAELVAAINACEDQDTLFEALDYASKAKTLEEMFAL